MVSALAQPCCALPSPTVSAQSLCSNYDVLSLPLYPSHFVFLIVRACLRVYFLCATRVEGGAPPPPPQPPAHPTGQYQTGRLVWPATSAVRGTVDHRASVRASPLYPRTVPWLHLSIRTARRRCGRPKRKEHYRKPGLSRGHPCDLLVPPSALCTCHTSSAPCPLHPAAPGPRACTRNSCTLQSAPTLATLHLVHPASPFRIAAPCPSRRHYPRSWHASTSTESGNSARYRTTTVCPSTDTLPGHGTEPGRARPSPLRVNHDLPCHALHRSLP